jgi:predicted fused transcriptional regulator/phosphomethylpyrimidine kinase/predicted transcriptional regulator
VRNLVERYNWSIGEAAKKLEISVTAASKYKRILKEETNISVELLERLSGILADGIANNKISPEAFVEQVCSHCMIMRVEGDICRIHRNALPDLVGCNACHRTFVNLGGGSTERMEVLNELNRALSALSMYPRFDRLIPEVRTNIVMCTKDPKDTNDVAAFPGRITVMKGRAAAVSRPEFGASRHMSIILLTARKINPNVRAVTCIKYDKIIEQAMKQAGLQFIVMDRSRYESIERFLQTLEDIEDGVVDPGGAGIEPVVYIFGKNAINVVEKIIKIVNKIDKIEMQQAG